jgi:hypothetical protein
MHLEIDIMDPKVLGGRQDSISLKHRSNGVEEMDLRLGNILVISIMPLNSLATPAKLYRLSQRTREGYKSTYTLLESPTRRMLKMPRQH